MCVCINKKRRKGKVIAGFFFVNQWSEAESPGCSGVGRAELRCGRRLLLFLLLRSSSSAVEATAGREGGWGGWEEARQSELHGSRGGRQEETNPGEATASLGCPLARRRVNVSHRLVQLRWCPFFTSNCPAHTIELRLRLLLEIVTPFFSFYFFIFIII